MTKALGTALALFTSACLAACVPGDFGTRFQARLDETRPLPAGGAFSLENTNGSVRLATWGEPHVRIEATKGAGSREALEAIEIAIESDGDGVRVRTRLPHGFFARRGGRVDYEVHVPAGTRLTLKNVNGNVEVRDAGGAVRASTVNGSVEASGVAGEIAASTVNGSVDVTVTHVEPGTRSSLGATNGSVRLTLPRDAAADVELHTVNGRAECGFDLEGGGRSTRRNVEGRIGGGGARFELRTVNGSAHVDRGLGAASATTRAPLAEATPAAAAR